MLVAALVVGVAILAGCNVAGRVDVSVHDDGSGTVSVAVGLDDAALGQLGDPEKVVRTEDLTEAGWSVSPPERRSNRTWIRASKPFRSAADLGNVMDEVGLFSRWKLSVEDGFGSTTWKVTGRIDARSGIEQFSDDQLAAALDGLSLGMTPEEVQRRLEEHGPLGVDVSVHLPGSTDDRTRFLVDVAADSPQQRVSVTSERFSGAPTRWFALGGVLMAGAATLGGVAHFAVTRRRYRRRR